MYETVIEKCTGFFDVETIKEAATLWSLKLVGALAIIIIGRMAVKTVLYLIRRLLNKADVDATLSDFIYNLSNIVLQIFTYTAAISALGIETNAIFAMMGAAGLAVGLALQNMLSSFASGVLIIFFRYLKKGDLVEVAGVKGVVEEVQIFNTIFSTDDNKTVILPNNKITSDKIYIHNKP
jgi:small conductance mechanosensitive channel